MSFHEFFQGKRVFVTGASGFLGRNLLARLTQLGPKVAVLSYKNAVSIPGVQVLRGDLTQANTFVTDLVRFSPQIVFHLAAFKERKSELSHYRRAIETNLIGTLNLFEALPASSLESVIVLGTGEEYGHSPVPYMENTREDPVNAYSWSKTALSHLCQLFFASKKIPVTILRPGLAYGPGQTDDMFIPALIAALKENRPFPMSFGEQTRDFIYVDDLIEAMLVCCTLTDARGEIFNIGHGLPVTLADVALKVETLMGKENLVQMGAVPYREQEIMDYYLDVSKAKKILDFTPKVNLTDGLKRTIQAAMKA